MKVTTKGGGDAYNMVRSKHVKGPDGYGKVIQKVREKWIADHDGKDPGPDIVLHHKNPGSHKGRKLEGPVDTTTRGQNTAISNKERVQFMKDKIKHIRKNA